MERFGGRVTAPIKSTTLGCLNLIIISACKSSQYKVKKTCIRLGAGKIIKKANKKRIRNQ